MRQICWIQRKKDVNYQIHFRLQTFLSSPESFMRNHFWLCRDGGITISLFLYFSLSLSPPSLSFSVSLLFKGPHCTVRGRTNDSWGGEERGDREDRQRENEGRCSLCTSLIQHCRGTVFYFRPAEGTVRCGGASIYKEESSVLQMRSRELIQLLLVLRTFRLPF